MCTITRYLALAGVLILFASAATAEIPNKSPQKLRQAASHVLTGKIGRIYSTVERQGDFEHMDRVAAVSVASVEKGGGMAESDLVYVRFWRRKWIGAGDPDPGHAGHRGVPNTGDLVRAYVKKQTDGGYDVISPNGFVVMDQTKGVNGGEGK